MKLLPQLKLLIVIGNRKMRKPRKKLKDNLAEAEVDLSVEAQDLEVVRVEDLVLVLEVVLVQVEEMEFRV